MKLKVVLLVLFALALNVGVAAAQSDDTPELYTATVVPCPSDILEGAALPAAKSRAKPWSAASCRCRKTMANRTAGRSSCSI